MSGEVRIELRRSAALPAALVGAAMYAALLWQRPDKWDDGWIELTLNLRNDLFALLPLALAAGAWQGGRERRARVEELFVATPRPLWQRVLPPVVAVALGAVLAVAVPFAVGVARGEGQWLGQAWPAAVLAVGLLAVVAAVPLGFGLGRLIRSNLVAPLALLVLSPVLAMLMTATAWPSLLAPVLQMPSSGSDTDQVRTGVTLAQAGWFTGLLVAGLVLSGAARARSRLLAVVPVAAGLAVAVPLLTASGGAAFVTDPVAGREFCVPGTPSVCGATVHEPGLRVAAGPAREALRALQKLPGAPTRAQERPEEFPFRPVPDGVLPIGSYRLDTSEHSPEFLLDLVDGLGVPLDSCMDASGDAFVQVRRARALTAAWVLDHPVVQQPFTGGPDPEGTHTLQQLRGLAAAEQQRRMLAAREGFRRCTVEGLAGL